jgi:F-type H+-transporting ATPase subunit b
MEDLATGGFVGKFGLDLRLLLAQVLNFLVVLLVLSRFVFRPLLGIMRQRSERITEGLRRAEDLQEKQRAFAAWQGSERHRAKREAARLLSQSEEEAHQRREAVLRQAEGAAQEMHDRAVADAARLQDAALTHAQHDAGVLVVEVTERVLGKRLSQVEREDYLQDALQEVRKRARGSR